MGDFITEMFEFGLSFHGFIRSDQEDAFHRFAVKVGFDGFDAGGFDAVEVGAELAVALFDAAHVGVGRFSESLFTGFEADGAQDGEHGVFRPDGFVSVFGDDGCQSAAGRAVPPSVGLQEADVLRG